MKYLKQFSIILGISFLGELLHHVLTLPIPGSIYGIVLLFACLMLKVIRPEQIRETSSFLIEIMPVMFIPAAVGLIDVWGFLKSKLFAYLFLIASTTVFVMAVSGIVCQIIIRKKEAGK